MFSGLSGLSLKHGHDAETPLNLSRAGDSGETLLQSHIGTTHIVVPQQYQCQGEVVLVVVRVTADSVSENFGRAGILAHMRMKVAQQGENGVVLLSLCGNLTDCLKCIRIMSPAEVGICQIKFHI